MRLVVKCTNCRQRISFSKPVKDRFALAKKFGQSVELSCTKCNSIYNYEVNDIKAEESKITALIALVTTLVASISLFIYLWPYFFETSYIYAISGLIGALVVPSLFYQAFNFSVNQRVKYFNSKRYG